MERAKRDWGSLGSRQEILERILLPHQIQPMTVKTGYGPLLLLPRRILLGDAAVVAEQQEV
jgi:hypothetical protein